MSTLDESWHVWPADRPVTVASVRAFIGRIRHWSTIDDEECHMAQDALYVAVLKAIADGSAVDDPAELVAQTLAVLDVPFTRYYC